MTTYAFVLRVFAIAVIAAATCHCFLGLGAERLLDPTLPADILRLASLDNQNRFYGVMFGTTGALLWHAAAEIERYSSVIWILLWGGLLAGMSRLLSIAWVGWPSLLVTTLMAIELLGTLALLAWHVRIRRAGRSTRPHYQS